MNAKFPIPFTSHKPCLFNSFFKSKTLFIVDNQECFSSRLQKHLFGLDYFSVIQTPEDSADCYCVFVSGVGIVFETPEIAV